MMRKPSSNCDFSNDDDDDPISSLLFESFRRELSNLTSGKLEYPTFDIDPCYSSAVVKVINLFTTYHY